MLPTSTWRDHFPGLSGISQTVSAVLDTSARISTIKQGAVLFGPGSPANNLLLLVSGTVRVQQLSESGREIVLYRVHSGESCVLTTACLLAFENYSAEGIAETDLEAVLVPRDGFDELMSISREFRAFVFEAYSKRITDLFLVIEEIAFKRMDVRLAERADRTQGRPGRVAPDASSACRRTRHRPRGGFPATEGIRTPGLGAAEPWRDHPARSASRQKPGRNQLNAPLCDKLTDMPGAGRAFRTCP